LGVTGQIVLVTGVVMSPMLWPQMLPPATFVMVVPHAPPGRMKGKPAEKPQAHVTTARRRFPTTGLVAPSTVPTVIPTLIDPIEVGSNYTSDSCVGCVEGGIEGGSAIGVLGPLLPGPEPPRPEKPRVVEAPKPIVTTVPRVVPGGRVREPRLIYKVDPPYPPLAKTAHVQGVVKLTGVISTDGRIIELVVASGHPLLVKAAFDAVRQWRYEPTLLNEVPVEVQTTIIVTFALTQ
jgi:protein TonB